jgi:23S rRNA pseudouridine2457 synthase
VISRFTPDGSANRTLAELGFPKDVYPIGWLDADSEGLLLLSDEPGWNKQLLQPRHAHQREYWTQVERVPTLQELRQVEKGIVIRDRKTLPCRAWMLEPQPDIPPREPTIRFRNTVRPAGSGWNFPRGKIARSSPLRQPAATRRCA